MKINFLNESRSIVNRKNVRQALEYEGDPDNLTKEEFNDLINACLQVLKEEELDSGIKYESIDEFDLGGLFDSSTIAVNGIDIHKLGYKLMGLTEDEDDYTNLIEALNKDEINKKYTLDKLKIKHEYDYIDIDGDKVTLSYSNLPVSINYNTRSEDDWDTFEDEIEWEYIIRKNDFEELVLDSPLIQDIFIDLDDDEYIQYIHNNLEELSEKYKDYFLEYLEKEAIENAKENYEIFDDNW